MSRWCPDKLFIKPEGGIDGGCMRQFPGIWSQIESDEDYIRSLPSPA
jgi:hypothetical protein